jgi:hypothetical protein
MRLGQCSLTVHIRSSRGEQREEDKSVKRTTSLKVMQVGKPITVEVEELSFSVAEKDKEGFLRNPGRFLANLLKKNGYTVNAMHVVSSEVERLKRSVQKRGAGTTSTWHCTAPPRMKCRRIVVISK